MNNKTITLALVQALAHVGHSVSVAEFELAPDAPELLEQLPGSINITGDIHGNVNIYHCDCDDDCVPEGGDGDYDGGDGPMDCDDDSIPYEDVLEEKGFFDSMYFWFNNSTGPVDYCTDDDFLVWMLNNYGSTSCYELRDWMVGNMEQTGLNFEELGQDVNQNRPWMSDRVINALFESWMICFPDFWETSDADIDVDFIRNLVPNDEMDTEDDFDRYNDIYNRLGDDPEYVEEVLTTWFLGDHAQVELDPLIDIVIIQEALNQATQECGILEDWMNNILIDSDWHYDSVVEHLNEDRFDEARVLVVEAWQTCFPEHAEDSKTPDTEINADWLIHHLDV